jgi:DNA segregation ATPase FtsK/SpoIIIE-like protein
MFKGLSNIEINKTPEEFDLTLEYLIQEYQRRDSLLYLPELELATDAKDVLEKYPHMYHHFKPIFVLIDEYARFADNKEIQKKVTELVESARYVNIHIIIATQRPDARTVLPPRIKANLLTRVCFTTADEANSIIILDKTGAESLGRISGRAILSDGEINTIQVPFISTDEIRKQLKPYKKETESNEQSPNQENKGCSNTELSSKIQDMFKESTNPTVLSEQFNSSKHLQQNDEKVVNGWFRLASTKGKG